MSALQLVVSALKLVVPVLKLVVLASKGQQQVEAHADWQLQLLLQQGALKPLCWQASPQQEEKATV